MVGWYLEHEAINNETTHAALYHLKSEEIKPIRSLASRGRRAGRGGARQTAACGVSRSSNCCGFTVVIHKGLGGALGLYSVCMMQKAGGDPGDRPGNADHESSVTCHFARHVSCVVTSERQRAAASGSCACRRLRLRRCMRALEDGRGSLRRSHVARHTSHVARHTPHSIPRDPSLGKMSNTAASAAATAAG